jgi:Tol biopolymer transport system component/DNA-binding winged helix-turn-helix (wHTH) protein
MPANHDRIYEFRGFRLEPRRRRVSDPAGKLVALRSREFEALCELVRRAGTPVLKDELMAAVWPGTIVEENNLNQAISKLRQALGDDRHAPCFIATLPGRGYQFIADVRVSSPRAAEAVAVPTAPPVEAPPRRPFPAFRALSIGVLLAAGATIGILAILDNRRPTLATAPAFASLENSKILTKFAGSNTAPTISPDGTMMAFVSDQTGNEQIWVQGLPDGTPVQLTTGGEPARSPSWSPVDDAILFQRAAPEGGQAAWLVDALGSRPERLLVPDAYMPKFSADGRHFTFTRNHVEIFVASIDGGKPRRVEGIPETPGFATPMAAMNASGDIALVLADEGPAGNLWLLDAGTREARPLTNSRNSFAGVFARSPEWAPDGRSIIYAAADGEPGNMHLWRVDVVSDEVHRLTSGVGGYSQPAVARDGSLLLYSYAMTLWRIVRTDSVSGEHQTLHESRTGIALPHVSRDGTKVLYFMNEMYFLDINGGEPVQLSFAGSGRSTLPVWSRSEDTIYYYRDRSLHRLDPVTGVDERVVEDFHWSSRNWHAVHEQRVAYHIKGTHIRPGSSEILDLQTGSKTTLDEPLWPTDFSRDGLTLLGRRQGDHALLTCSAPDFGCTPILHAGEPVQGAVPRWSADESRIFFRRALSRPGYAEIWVVDRSGGEPAPVVTIGPYEPENMFFGVAADDSIIWNQYDSTGRSEIWMATIATN